MTLLALALAAAASAGGKAEVDMQSSVQISEWRELPGGWGDALFVAGDRVVAAGSGGAWIFQGGELIRNVRTEGAFSVGVPRLAGGRLFYGTGRERESGHFEPLLLPAVPGAPRAAAWSADGSRVAVLWVHAGEGRLLELRADGSLLREVWSGSPPPDALWYGAGAIVSVGRTLRAFSAAGQLHAEGHQSSIAAVSASRDEALLLTVGWEGAARLWQTRNLSLSGELRGDFSGGALSPDGRFAVLVSRAGGLQAACIESGRLQAAGSVSVSPAPVAVVLGDGLIVGSFPEGARLRIAEIRVDCD